VALAGVTGLLVWGQAQTTLRGQSFRVGTAHFWLGIVVALLAVIAAADWFRTRRREGFRHRPKVVPVVAVLALVGVFAQGYLGGRMTYNEAVGVYDGGQLRQTAVGAARLQTDLATGMSNVQAGRRAFAATGLGCARCHGDLAQGQRGPNLQGGRGLDDFRSVHQHGLFPVTVVTDRDFAAIDAWLRTLGTGRPHD